MELDTNIEDIEFANDEQKIQESQVIVTKLVTQQPLFYEEDSLTLHSASFKKYSKRCYWKDLIQKERRLRKKQI